MTPSSLRELLPRCLAFAALAVLLSAPVLAQAPARTDGQIEMDAVHALDAAPQLKDELITVATIQGEVTISGTVSTNASKDLAEAIVSGVKGVQKVHNNLQIGNPQQAEAAQNEGQAAPADDQTADAQPAPAPPADQPQAAPDAGQMQDHHIPQAPYPPPYGRRSPYGYAPQQPQPPQPTYRMATGPITVPQGTLLILRNETALDAKQAKDGAMADFTLLRDVALGDVLAIPRGATVHGVVVDAKKAGALGGSPELSIKLTSLDLGGQNYPLISDSYQVKGPNKAGRTFGSALAGSMVGAIIGCAAGHRGDCGRDAGIGAGAGAVAGTAAAAASPGPDVWIPAETRVNFHLTAPLTVNPVSREEAQRLAQTVAPRGPAHYRRGGPYARPPYVVAYPYGYPYAYPPPPVYYRPY